MSMRNSEKPKDQGMDGPDHYDTYADIVVAYVNLLEERIYVLDLELNAMRDRFGHQLRPEDNMPNMGIDPSAARPQEPSRDNPLVDLIREQLEDMRSKNTGLEAHIQELGRQLKDARQTIEFLRNENLKISTVEQSWAEFDKAREASRKRSPPPPPDQLAREEESLQVIRDAEKNRQRFVESALGPVEGIK